MSEFEIELLLTDRSYVIGNANDEASALNLMAEAIRQYPRNHIRVRRGAAIIAERCRRGNQSDRPPTVPGVAAASPFTPAIVEVGGRSLGVVRLAITEKGRTTIVR